MNRNEALEFLRAQSPAAFYGMPFNKPVGFDWSLVDGKFCQDGSTPICERDVRAQAVTLLQTKIETMLDIKFENEEKLLETIGSLWGRDLRNEVYELITPLRIESDKGPLDTLRRLVRSEPSVVVPSEADLRKKIGQLLNLEFDTTDELMSHLATMVTNALEHEPKSAESSVANMALVSKTYGKPLRNANELIAAVYDLVPYRNTHNDLEPTIRKILSVPDSHDWYQICDEVRLVHKQASDLHNVATLLLECGVMGERDTVLGASKQLIEQKEELGQIKEFASHYSHLGKERVTQVIARLAKSAQRPMKPVKTYWDGVEPLRVGHIVEQGVVEVPAGTKSCIRNHSDELVLVRTSNLKPSPFAKYTEQEREFLQSQIKAGVIKLC